MKNQIRPVKHFSIRTRLQAAFAVIVGISIAAIIFSWISVNKTRENLDIIVSETLPLISSSLKLEKYAHLFALSINEFHQIKTQKEHEVLMGNLAVFIDEIEANLNVLDQHNFDNTRVKLIRTQLNELVNIMVWQNRQFQDFITINTKLNNAVTTLKKNQHDFIALTTPQIDNSYLDFLEKSDKISAEMRDYLSGITNKNEKTDAIILDDKLRVAFETLVSSAAGEMRYTLEAVALTYLATSLLYEAASSQEVTQVDELKNNFLDLLPKIKTIKLILSHSTPDKYEVIISAMPIFKSGTNDSDSNIFYLRRHELLLRESAEESAIKALGMAENLALELGELNALTENLNEIKTSKLYESLKNAQIIQIILGVSAVLFSLFIIWFYVERAVIQRISRLRMAMEKSTKSGTVDIPVSGNDELSYMANALRDFVDQRTEAELLLRTTLEELNAVLDNIDYGIVFIDKDLNMQLTNRAFINMWHLGSNQPKEGTPLDQLIDSRKCKSITHDHGKPISWQSGRVSEILCDHTSRPIEIETNDGRFFRHQCFKIGEHGKMLTFFNITDLKENQRRLILAKKTETIGLMAGGVAHDLNNILSGIVSYPDLLLSQLPADSKLKKPLETIRESGQRAASVVSDLLTITRGTEPVKEIVDANEIIRQYLSSPEGIHLIEAYPKATIVSNLSPGELYCWCAPTQIKKCLMNLILNAAEALEINGEIIITTKGPLPLSAPSLEVDSSSNLFIELTVSDTGPGISDEDIQHIFEPFYSRKIMGRSGTGLGLTIVWNTLRDHQGTITVDSGSSGTSFKLYLPFAEEVDFNQEKVTSSQAITGKQQHILVVDDEQLQRNLAEEILTTLKYEVTTVSSGEEAIELIKKQEFDLVLLDMIMSPGINGRETYEQIISIRPTQQAIIVSGYYGSEDNEKLLSLGVTESIHKPYTVNELGEKLKEFFT